MDSLRGLLDLLFPDAQNPDILTVDDVIRRYPLTGLGAPAAAAMEQSRRILRARRDYLQIGLGDFHAGLIFLYWGDSRAAAQQFATARAQWSLASDIPVGCLAYFAQGLALQHGYHFEAAMTQFGWAERCLGRNQVGAQAAQLGILGDKMWPLSGSRAAGPSAAPLAGRAARAKWCVGCNGSGSACCRNRDCSGRRGFPTCFITHAAAGVG